VQRPQLHPDEDRGARALSTVVDTHTHFIPLEFVEFLRTGGEGMGLEVVDRNGRDPLVAHDNGLQYPVFGLFHDSASPADRYIGRSVPAGHAASVSQRFVPVA